MKVSVIIPSYNEEKYIEKTLISIQNQQYKDMEIIFVDNNSTDSTKDIVKKFDKVLFIEEKRKGVQFARECGRLHASGDLIANLDADCLPPPDWLIKGSKYFEDPNVVAVSGPYYYYDGGLFFRMASFITQKFFYTLFYNISYYLFHKGAIVLGGNVIIRANALEQIGGYNTSIKFYGDDTDTGQRLLSVGKVLFKNNMTISSSARRFKEEGSFKTFFTYISNFFWVIFFKKPFNNKHGD